MSPRALSRIWHSVVFPKCFANALNRRIMAGLLSSIFCTYAASASAAPPSPDAAAALREGRISYNSGDYEGAIQSFKRAYAARADNEVLYQLGKAYAMADWPVEAVVAFERYLDTTQLSEERRREVTTAIDGQRRRTGSLIVHVTPDSATIKVDDRLLVGSDHSMPLPVRKGAHLVSASAEGYVPQVQSVQVHAGKSSIVSIVLTPIVPPTHNGLLLVRCPLPSVAVFVDHHKVTSTSPNEPILIPEGSHHLSLQRAGYQTQTASIRISRAKTTVLDCRLPMALPLESSGQLSLEIPQIAAEVLVDGFPVSRSSRLPAGVHSVEVRHYAYEPWIGRVQVDENRVHRIDVRLTPTRSYLRDLEQRERARRTWSYALGATGLALAGTAIGVGLWNHHRYSDWARDRMELERAYGATSGTPSTSAELATRRDDVNGRLHSIHTVDIVTAILGVTGGMLLGSSTLLLLTAEQPLRQNHAPTAWRRLPHGIRIDVAW